MTRAVFLDRDGVLNEAIIRDGRPYPPRDLDEFVIVSDAPAALDALRRAGYRLIVATNQPDIARGTTTSAAVARLNQQLRAALPVDAIEVCEHDTADRCACRKPAPGLLTGAAERDGIDLAASFMVGDRWRDIEAGRRAGCRTVLIGDGYGEALKSRPDVTVGGLTEAVRWILAQPLAQPERRDPA
jgi:D-glycero-D-manno-heptose 1,7-bisphosphate phosphatase